MWKEWPTIVSPSRGRWGTLVTRSIFVDPTTQIVGHVRAMHALRVRAANAAAGLALTASPVVPAGRALGSGVGPSPAAECQGACGPRCARLGFELRACGERARPRDEKDRCDDEDRTAARRAIACQVGALVEAVSPETTTDLHIAHRAEGCAGQEAGRDCPEIRAFPIRGGPGS